MIKNPEVKVKELFEKYKDAESQGTVSFFDQGKMLLDIDRIVSEEMNISGSEGERIKQDLWDEVNGLTLEGGSTYPQGTDLKNRRIAYRGWVLNAGLDPAEVVTSPHYIKSKLREDTLSPVGDVDEPAPMSLALLQDKLKLAMAASFATEKNVKELLAFCLNYSRATCQKVFKAWRELEITEETLIETLDHWNGVQYNRRIDAIEEWLRVHGVAEEPKKSDWVNLRIRASTKNSFFALRAEAEEIFLELFPDAPKYSSRGQVLPADTNKAGNHFTQNHAVQVLISIFNYLKEDDPQYIRAVLERHGQDLGMEAEVKTFTETEEQAIEREEDEVGMIEPSDDLDELPF